MTGGTWHDPKASCGNFYRVRWIDGSETGYPDAETRARAMNALAHLTYRTELTPAGEQTVIPGCERDAAPGVRQLSLF